VRSKNLLIFLPFIVCFGALLLCILYVAGITIRSVLLIIIALSLVGPIAIGILKNRVDLLEPIILSNISLGVMFIGRPLNRLATGEKWHLGYEMSGTFDEALLIALIGIIFLQLGYYSYFGRTLARKVSVPLNFPPQKIAAAAWFYLILGTSLFGIFLSQQGGIGILFLLLEGRQQSNSTLVLNSTGYLYNGILMFGASSLMFFALAIVTGRRFYWVWFLISATVLLVFYGARGARSQILPLLLAIPIFWYLIKQYRPKASTVILVTVVSVALMGWLRDTRLADENRDFINTAVTAISSPIEQAKRILGGSDAEMFDSLANELLVVPEQLHFQHGATITDVMIRAVPRPWWPDKPLESNDALVNTLWPEHYAMSRASPAFSIIGVAYADSGYFSVVLIMFLIGVMMSALWRWRQLHYQHPLVQMIYAMGVPFIVILMRGTIPDTLTRMLFLFMPLLLLLWLVRIRLIIR